MIRTGSEYYFLHHGFLISGTVLDSTVFTRDHTVYKIQISQESFLSPGEIIEDVSRRLICKDGVEVEKMAKAKIAEHSTLLDHWEEQLQMLEEEKEREEEAANEHDVAAEFAQACEDEAAIKLSRE